MSHIQIDVPRNFFLHQQLDEAENSLECPVGMIQNSYFEFRDVGLDLSDIFKWQIHGCDFYNAGDQIGANVGGDCVYGTAYDIHLRNANIVNVMGCRFNRSASPKRYHVYVDADNAGTPGNAMNVLIGQNQFGDDIGGVGGISAIVLSPDAKSVVIGVNAYIGQYSGSIVDDQTNTGQATAPLGFPSTSTANPPATVPSAYAENLSPTLGTGTAPWPASFSLLHTVPKSSKPSNAPPSGWVLYTDTDNNLYALWQDGTTVVPLAKHT